MSTGTALALAISSFTLATSTETFCGLLWGAILSHQRYTPKPTTTRSRIVRIIFPRVVIRSLLKGVCYSGLQTLDFRFKTLDLFLLLRNLLPFRLGRGCRRRRRRRFGLHHAHLLLVFLEQRRAADFASVLLAGDARTHFLGQVERRAHLALAGGCGLPELLHGLAQLAAHHALQFGDRTLHHAREVLERAPDGHLGFDCLEFALELLNLAQALGDDRRVLLVKLFQVVRLGLVIVQVRFHRGQFFGVMRAVGLVIGRRCRLQQALQLLPLALLALDLVPQQRDLPGQLAVGIMCLVGLGFGVADAALDDGLVDGIGFGGLLRHQAHPYKQPLDRSKHTFSFYTVVPALLLALLV